jgi:hypothetical protein
MILRVNTTSACISFRASLALTLRGHVSPVNPELSRNDRSAGRVCDYKMKKKKKKKKGKEKKREKENETKK